MTYPFIAGYMNKSSTDTHGVKDEGHIGIDLDGTLAHYTEWKGSSVIGSPVKPMIRRVKEALEDGKKLKIITARVAPGRGQKTAIKAVKKWCRKHIGQELPVTYVKDRTMKELWDDRAVQVDKNTGRKKRRSTRTKLEGTK